MANRSKFQFQLLTLLGLVGAVALLLASLRVHSLSRSAPRFLLLAVLVAAGSVAMFYRGKKQAFALGFFLAAYLQFLIFPDQNKNTNWLYETIVVPMTLSFPELFDKLDLSGLAAMSRTVSDCLIGVAGGLLSVVIYSRSRQEQ